MSEINEVYDAQKNDKRHIFINVRNSFWVAVAILAILLILSVVVLSVRIVQYAYSDDREVLLDSNIHKNKLDIFDVVYKNAYGEITVSGLDDDKVVAPGTKTEYTIRIRNIDNIAIDYELLFGIELLSEYKLPIQVRVLAPDGSYILGSEKSWAELDELSNLHHRNTLVSGDAVEYVFQWKWPYESGDDRYDTFLGNMGHDIEIKVFFTVDASANLDIGANGGLVASGWAKNIVIMIFAILLIIAIILLIISIINRKINSTPPPAPAPLAEEDTDTEVPAVEIKAEPIVPTIPEKPNVKKEGFYGKMAYINIDVLNENFEHGDVITLSTLKKKGLLPADTRQMKILARNGYKLDKAFIVETQGISSEARKLITAAGGIIVITKG